MLKKRLTILCKVRIIHFRITTLDGKATGMNLLALKSRLRDIEEEKKAILKLIFIYQKPFKGKIFDGENSEKYSTRRQSAVVDLALRLIQQSGVPVQTYEVGRQAIEEKIFNGTFAEKRAYVSMILNAETRKKFGCLKKIGRGKFDVR